MLKKDGFMDYGLCTFLYFLISTYSTNLHTFGIPNAYKIKLNI